MGRQTAVGEMETHSPAQTTTDGAGRMGASTKPRRKTAWSFRNAIAAAREAAAAAALAAGFLLLCFDSTDHVTLSHETRICRLPRAAAQQIAAAQYPGSCSAAEHAHAPRLPSGSEGRGRPRASRGSRGHGTPEL